MKHPDYEPRKQRVSGRGASKKDGLAWRETAVQPGKDSCKYYGKTTRKSPINHLGGTVHDIFYADY